MTAVTPELVGPRQLVARNPFGPLATLVVRRFQLSARTPRELVVPLLTPVLFALVIAPALKEALHTSAAYEAYVATGTIGLLIPLNTMFAGIGVLVDRESGAQRELLAAPISRSLLVLANLVVAFAVTALQIGVLLGVSRARGIHFDINGAGVLWFLAAGLALHDRDVRRGRDARRACSPHGGVHRPPAGDRHRPLVPRRVALPDHRAPGVPDLVRPRSPAHAWPRARPLRAARRLLGPARRSGRCTARRPWRCSACSSSARSPP